MTSSPLLSDVVLAFLQNLNLRRLKAFVWLDVHRRLRILGGIFRSGFASILSRTVAMTYHMERHSPWWQVESTEVFPKGKFALQFPWKLWHAASSLPDLVSWNEVGTEIEVNADDFERQVMTVYPGLVEISTFANFRRQMREYGFVWIQRKDTAEFTFSHPCFLRDRKDLLHLVVTRRRSRKLGRADKLPVRRNEYSKSSAVSPSATFPPSNWGSSTKKRSSDETRHSPEKITRQSTYLTSPGFKRSRIDLIRKRTPTNQTPVKKFHVSLSSASAEMVRGERVNFDRKKGYEEVGQEEQQEEAWWNNCFHWVLQQDPDLSRQYEIDYMTASLKEQNQRLGGVPFHFYPDEFQDETNAFDLPMTWDSTAESDLLNAQVIEIKPIPDDPGFSSDI